MNEKFDPTGWEDAKDITVPEEFDATGWEDVPFDPTGWESPEPEPQPIEEAPRSFYGDTRSTMTPMSDTYKGTHNIEKSFEPPKLDFNKPENLAWDLEQAASQYRDEVIQQRASDLMHSGMEEAKALDQANKSVSKDELEASMMVALAPLSIPATLVRGLVARIGANATLEGAVAGASNFIAQYLSGMDVNEKEVLLSTVIGTIGGAYLGSKGSHPSANVEYTKQYRAIQKETGDVMNKAAAVEATDDVFETGIEKSAVKEHARAKAGDALVVQSKTKEPAKTVVGKVTDMAEVFKNRLLAPVSEPILAGKFGGLGDVAESLTDVGSAHLQKELDKVVNEVIGKSKNAVNNFIENKRKSLAVDGNVGKYQEALAKKVEEGGKLTAEEEAFKNLLTLKEKISKGEQLTNKEVKQLMTDIAQNGSEKQAVSQFLIYNQPGMAKVAPKDSFLGNVASDVARFIGKGPAEKGLTHATLAGALGPAYLYTIGAIASGKVGLRTLKSYEKRRIAKEVDALGRSVSKYMKENKGKTIQDAINARYGKSEGEQLSAHALRLYSTQFGGYLLKEEIVND